MSNYQLPMKKCFHCPQAYKCSLNAVTKCPKLTNS